MNNQPSKKIIVILSLLLLTILMAGCAQPTEVALAAPLTKENEQSSSPIIIAEDSVDEGTETQELSVIESEDVPVEPPAVSGDDALDGRGRGPADPPCDDPGNCQPPSGELTAAEIDGLLFMREEEKLARDLYLTYYDQWNLRIFKNIAGSEQTHMGAILTVIERYGLEDPIVSDEVGVFSNADLQDLYNKLATTTSAAEALKNAAAVEEIDIVDLQEQLATAESEDLIRLYENLLRGSENHLRAFVSMLEQQSGESYEPQYLSPEEYAAIMAGGSARGNGPGDNGEGRNFRGQPGKGGRGGRGRGG